VSVGRERRRGLDMRVRRKEGGQDRGELDGYEMNGVKGDGEVMVDGQEEFTYVAERREWLECSRLNRSFVNLFFRRRHR